jgi:hypothetical protein
MRDGRCASLRVKIVHHQARVYNSRDPPEQRQNEAQKETGDTSGQEHGQRRKNDAEEISQRFHRLFLPGAFFAFVPGCVFSNS